MVEVSARPGEAVESGQILIRVAGFNRLLARLYVPLGQTIDSRRPARYNAGRS